MKRLPQLAVIVVFIAVCGLVPASGAARFQEKREKHTKPLKVTSAPRVKISDAAIGERGWVRLKIEYRSDGTIGKIECINPDDENRRRMERKGLIEASIKAARQIKFRPRTVDGNPVTVVRTRDYLFNW